MSIDSTNGLIQWIPTQAQIGDHSVTLTIMDGNGRENNLSLTITVANLDDPPSVTSTAPLTALEGMTLATLVDN